MKTKIYNLSSVFIIVLVYLMMSSSIHAQDYEKMSYQAVIRDASNNLVTNQIIGMQVSILIGTTTVAYSETHTPSTNANGLVSIEVGDGTIVSGYFPDIPWHWGGPFFIKTEVDPTGGTNYTITATSQLMSVPFAINAERAEMADLAEVALIAENIVEYTAGDGIDITNAVVSNTAISTTYTVGDFAQGGIIIYVDETGQHGLVCKKSDFDDNTYRWSYGSTWFPPSYGAGLFSGEMNTLLIIAKVGEGTALLYAAEACAYQTTTEGDYEYGDWYLPSIGELTLMYNLKDIINTTALANGGIAFYADFYWSSNPNTNDLAWGKNFDTGQQSQVERSEWHRVRSIRAF